MVAARALFEVPKGLETRWASSENWDGTKGQGGTAKGGRKGSPCFTLNAGEQKVLAHAENTSGMIRRIWITINDRTPAALRGLRLEMFWDGADQPAVSAPLGDFFCQGLGRSVKFESALFSNPEGRSFNCCVPMPFTNAMRVVLTNESKQDIAMVFYDINYTIGDEYREKPLYFHAYWHRENPTTEKKDFEFLPRVAGKGRFLGVNCSVIADTKHYFKTWWGEGECKMYLDGDEEYPTLCGTGTEDYIGTAWGQGQYAHQYQGCPIADHENYQYAFYRFHIPDPVYFYKDIKVTMHQIGHLGAPERRKELFEAGRKLTDNAGKVIDLENPESGLFERHDDWASCAYFYLNMPVNNLAPLQPVEERIKGLFNPENASKRADL